ncbi:hypothetical protein [Deinococcus yunweiensis]|uniref:hypothetical protein n=1 Tax=Deinococcus yunweiensis TaxID=367282 RepID=UPI00398ED39C
MTAHRPVSGMAVSGTVEAVFRVTGRGVILLIRVDVAPDDRTLWVGGHVEKGSAYFPVIGIPLRLSRPSMPELELLVRAEEGDVAVGDSVTVVPHEG